MRVETLREKDDRMNAERTFAELWLRDYAVRINTDVDSDTAFEYLINAFNQGEILVNATRQHCGEDPAEVTELRHYAEIYFGCRPYWPGMTNVCIHAEAYT